MLMVAIAHRSSVEGFSIGTDFLMEGFAFCVAGVFLGDAAEDGHGWFAARGGEFGDPLPDGWRLVGRAEVGLESEFWLAAGADVADRASCGVVEAVDGNLTHVAL